MVKKARAKKQPSSTRTAATRRKNPAAKAARETARSAAAADKAAKARQQKHLKAVALYEKALDTLQRRKVPTAEMLFQRVIDDFPEERELHERCRRYLEVCARETTPQPDPRTLEERVYAATLAINAGAEQEALEHLEAALAEEPDSDQVQYMLAVARAASGESATAVTHLHRAIELNPDNRFLARYEPSFEGLHENEAFQQALESPLNNDA